MLDPKEQHSSNSETLPATNNPGQEIGATIAPNGPQS